MKRFFWSLIPVLTGFFLAGTGRTAYYPASVLLLDDYFTHHVFVAEKSTHKLHLYKNKKGIPHLEHTWQMATGKKAGDKLYQGDHRTPEGIYHFYQFIPHETLMQRYGKEGRRYGAGAFAMNYPNPVDRRKRKTGNGIWVHSTNEETRIEKGLDSRGCIVISNNDLKEFSLYMELHRTPIVVVQNILYLTESIWSKQQKEIRDFITSWLEAWKKEDLEGYIRHYHPKKFYDSHRGRIKSFSTYKKNLFSSSGTPHIEISHLNIMTADDYSVATFRQNYRSNRIDDTGHKRLYLQKDDYYNWKIVAEVWSSKGVGPVEISFRPSVRFLKNEDEK